MDLFGNWNLEIGDCLGFRAWNLEFLFISVPPWLAPPVRSDREQQTAGTPLRSPRRVRALCGATSRRRPAGPETEESLIRAQKTPYTPGWRDLRRAERSAAASILAPAARPGRSSWLAVVPERGGSFSKDHWGRATLRGPKSAVPTRTMVAPSSMAMGKSWVMPIESSRSCG